MTQGLTIYNIISITGHRNLPDPASFYRGLDNLRANEYIFGGARGADTEALKYMARTQPGVTRTVVVPNRVMHQPYEARAAIRLHGQKVIELRNTGFNRYQIRNEYMVNRSNHTRAFYDYRGRGGTYNTIEYCKANNKSYDVWNSQTMDQNEIMAKDKAAFDRWIQSNRDLKVNTQAVKGIALAYIKENLGMGVRDYLITLGETDETTLEGYFQA